MSKSHLSMLIRSSSLHLSKLHQHLIAKVKNTRWSFLTPNSSSSHMWPIIALSTALHLHRTTSIQSPTSTFASRQSKHMSAPIICLQPVYIPVASPCSQNLKQNLGLQGPALCAPTNLSSLISSHSSCTLGSSYNGLSVPHVPLPKLVVSPSG